MDFPKYYNSLRTPHFEETDDLKAPCFYPCKYCFEVLSSRHEAITHNTNHLRITLPPFHFSKCDICQVYFETQDSLMTHALKMHIAGLEKETVIEKPNCDFCGGDMTDLTQADGKVIKKCQDCHKISVKPVKHRHDSDEPHCKVCNSLLTKFTHSSKTAMICQVCNQDKNHLKKGKNVVDSNFTDNCKFCGSQLTKLTHADGNVVIKCQKCIKVNKKIHSNKRKSKLVECKYCGSRLLTQLTQIDGTVITKCHDCNKVNDKKDLKRGKKHIKKDKNEFKRARNDKSYCKSCNYLLTELLQDDGNVIVKCEFCDPVVVESQLEDIKYAADVEIDRIKIKCHDLNTETAENVFDSEIDVKSDCMNQNNDFSYDGSYILPDFVNPSDNIRSKIIFDDDSSNDEDQNFENHLNNILQKKMIELGNNQTELENTQPTLNSFQDTQQTEGEDIQDRIQFTEHFDQKIRNFEDIYLCRLCSVKTHLGRNYVFKKEETFREKKKCYLCMRPKREMQFYEFVILPKKIKHSYKKQIKKPTVCKNRQILENVLKRMRVMKK